MRKTIITILCIYFSLCSIGISQTFVVLGNDKGAAYLAKDNMDGFYDVVNPIDMAIQLKDSTAHISDRTSLISKYKASYKQEVLDPTDAEILKLKNLFDGLIQQCNDLNPDLLPDTIQVILVEGNHYGTTTFFTRGNAIVSSRASLRDMEPKNFRYVMLHELSHIITRYHHDLREDLYGLIGFQPLDGLVKADKSFSDQILYNPDGVHLTFAIDLMTSESTTESFVPVIYSKYPKFDPKQPVFFGYLEFKLLPVKKEKNHYLIQSPESAAAINYALVMQKYFERITMNTQYIIHPDEIIADNFMYLFRSDEENAQLDKQLLTQLKNTLKEFQK